MVPTSGRKEQFRCIITYAVEDASRIRQHLRCLNWGTPVVSGTFGKNANKKKVLFAGHAGKFVRLVAKSEVNGKPWTSAAEIRVLGTPVAIKLML